MPSTRSLLTSLAFLACGLAIGFVLRSRRAEETLDVRPASSAAVETGTAAAAVKHPPLSENARAVLAWLRRAVPEEDRNRNLPLGTVEDLKRIEALTSGEFPALLAAADQRRNYLLMERWAEVDAKAFVEWLTPYARRYDPEQTAWYVNGHHGGFGSPRFRSGLEALARVDPAAAERLKAANKTGADVIFMPIGTTVNVLPSPPPPPPPDPDFASMSGGEAWQWLKSKGRQQQVDSIAEEIQKTDPARAVAWLEDMPVSYDRERLLRTALLAAAKKPDAILGLLDKFGSSEDLHYALKYCQGLGRDHFPQISAWARQCGDPDKRRAAFRWMAESLPHQDKMETASAWLAELPPGPDRWTALETLAHYFPDPAAIAKQVVADAPAAGETQVLASLTSQWGRKDHEAATQWAQSLAAGHLRSQAMAGAWSAWADADRAASHEAAQVLSGADRAAALRGIASSGWSAQYPDQVMKWIAGLPPVDQVTPFAAAFAVEKMEGRLHAGVLPMLSQAAVQPVPAEDLPALLRIAGAAADTEAHRDISAATRWALALPPGEVRREVIATLTDRVLERPEAECQAWLQSLPAADRLALE